MDIKFRDDMTVQLVDVMGNDQSVVRAARVSTLAEGAGEGDLDKAKGLINFLMKNRHGTPFEHNSFTFLVQAPIFVFREFMRHRIGFSYNEESGRYRELRPIFYLPNRQRNLVQQGKPGAYEFVSGDDKQYEFMKLNMEFAYGEAYKSYQKMLQAGVAREVARCVLPVGIFSSMYVTCNARSIMAFLSLRTKRLDSHFPSYPQREIEMVAELMEEQFAKTMPLTYETFNANGRVCP